MATEVAYGASIGGVRSLCAMKHVGLNVAADPLFTAAYNGVGGGFVIVTADDPSMHSSQNEQDNRNYARSAKVALVEPSDSQECIDFMKEAYHISETFDMPVIFRTTTNISHSKSLVSFSERKEAETAPYVRNQPKFNCSPANAYRNHPKVEKNLRALEEYGETCPINKLELKGSKVGVVTASIAYQYAKDVFPEDTSFLKLGLTNPLPMKLIRDFAAKVEKLYVIEELEGFMEEQIKAAGIPCIGKEKVSNMYELNPQRLRQMLFGTEPEITFTLEDNTDFIVTFSKANPNENAKLADLKTVGDLYANVAELGSLMMEDKMVYGFELGGGYYRAIAEMTPDIFQAAMDLDMFDENYEEKQHELLAPLAVVRIEDLNKAALTKDEMDALAGKTVSELLADGWFFNGYNFEDMEFTADHDVSSYKLILEGEAPAKEDYSDEDLGPMTVVSVSYIGYSDLTNMEYEAPAAQ